MRDADVNFCVLVMGVSGCGKTTFGERLSQALGAEFVEGDAFHPPANIERMAAGIALTDADRQGWLETLAGKLGAAGEARRSVVLGCSALKRRYRDTLRSGAPGLRLVHLSGTRALLAQRLAARRGHYMPASLLDSQLATLEPPGPDEHAITLDIKLPADTLVRSALAQLKGSPT